MTLEFFLNNSHKYKVPLLPNASILGIDDLYEEVIKNTLPKKKIVEDWHNLLIKYSKQNHATFFIRRYASAANKNWNLIRRGFLTEHKSGLKYVFCDNYFAHYFYLMALHDFVPTIEEFSYLIEKRKFPYGYMKTSAEEPFQAFPKGNFVNINSSGWKLAHLYSVNQDDYNFDYKKECTTLFPRGNQSDWKSDQKDYPSRIINDPHTDEMRSKTVAHFLRLVHPINYFLVPQVKLSNYNIGEMPEVITYMRTKTAGIYGKIFNEFEDVILAKLAEPKKFTTTLNFKFGPSFTVTSPNKKSINKFVSKNTKIKGNVDLTFSQKDMQILKAYLMEKKSFRTIEMEILEIESPARGGGFVAKKLINSYGAEHKHKGVVTKNNIKSLIGQNQGLFKNTLAALQEYLQNN